VTGGGTKGDVFYSHEQAQCKFLRKKEKKCWGKKFGRKKKLKTLRGEG